MNLVRIAARIANTTIQVDRWNNPKITPSETVEVYFPDGKGPAFSGKFVEYLAQRSNMGMTEAEEYFGVSTEELSVGVELYWDDAEERMWFHIITIEDAVLDPETLRTLIENYNLEQLTAQKLENVLTDPELIQEIRRSW